MGSTNRIVLPKVSFTGQKDVKEFLRDFEIFVSVNEWQDKKAQQYLAVYLKDKVKVFYINKTNLSRKVLVSYQKSL